MCQRSKQRLLKEELDERAGQWGKYMLMPQLMQASEDGTNMANAGAEWAKIETNASDGQRGRSRRVSSLGQFIVCRKDPSVCCNRG